MEHAHLYVYNVGHGVCTLLIGDKDDGTKYCGVFDCGTKAQNPGITSESVVEDMVAEINKIGHIDDIVISHQDKDHHSMLWGLIKKLSGVEKNKFGKSGEKVFVESNSDNWKKLCIYEKIGKSYSFDEISRKGEVYFRGGVTFQEKSISYLWYALGTDIELFRLDMIMFARDSKEYKLICTFKAAQENVYNKVQEYITPDMVLIKLQEIINEDLLLQRLKCQILDKYNYLWGIKYDDVEKKVNEPNIPTPQYSINRIILGGEYGDYQYCYLKQLIEGIQDLCESYITGSGYIQISDREKGYHLRNMFSQITDPLKIELEKIPIKHNATSVVTQLMVDKGYSVLFPGDATYHTFDKLKKRLETPGKVCMMIAPHHGSDNTNFVYSQDGKQMTNQPIESLLSSIKGYTMIVSAYNGAGSAHPGEEFIKTALKYAREGVPDHEINQSDSKNKMSTINTQKAVYTTQCLDPQYVGYDFYDFPTPGYDQISEDSKEYKEYEIKEALDIPPNDCFI